MSMYEIILMCVWVAVIIVWLKFFVTKLIYVSRTFEKESENKEKNGEKNNVN